MKYFPSLIVILLLSGNANAGNSNDRKIARADDAEWNAAVATYQQDMGNYLFQKDQIDFNADKIEQSHARIVELQTRDTNLLRLASDPNPDISGPASKEIRKDRKELASLNDSMDKLFQANIKLQAQLKSKDDIEAKLAEVKTKVGDDLTVLKADGEVRRARKLSEELNSVKTQKDLDKQAQTFARGQMDVLYPDEADAFYAKQAKVAKTQGDLGNGTVQKTEGTASVVGKAETNVDQQNKVEMKVLSDKFDADTVAQTKSTAPIVAVAPPTTAVATNCDKAKVEVAKAILKDPKNSGIFSKMVKLSSLKMAYAMAKDSGNKNSLEEYANKLAINKDDATFKASISDLYLTYGAPSDQGTLEKLNNDKKYNYYDHKVRLTNDNASALALYIASTSDKTDPMSLTTQDAAVIWAQQKVFQSKKMAIGLKNDTQGNLLNFSTQVYHLINFGTDKTTDQLKARYEKNSSEIKNTILSAVKGLKSDEQQCFKDVASLPCNTNSVSLGSESLQGIQGKLAQLVSTGSLVSDDVKLDLDLDSGVTTKDGVITIQAK